LVFPTFSSNPPPTIQSPTPYGAVLTIQPLLTLSIFYSSRPYTQVELRPPYLKGLSTNEIHQFRSAYEAYSNYIAQKGMKILGVAALMDVGIVNYIYLRRGSIDNSAIFSFLDDELVQIKPNANLAVGLKMVKLMQSPPAHNSLTKFWISLSTCLTANGYQQVVDEFVKFLNIRRNIYNDEFELETVWLGV
jgi:hypothetical protein